MINTAIVGYGRSSRTYHLPFLKVLSDFNIQGFVSSNQKKVEDDYPQAKVYKNVDELANDPEINLAVITSPVFVHFEQIKTLLNAGKHIVVEKPFTATEAEARELVELASAKNVKLCIFKNRRWDSSFLKLKELINDGSLGEINSFEAHFDRYRPEVRDRWQEGEHKGSGVVYEIVSHFVDQVFHLFGEPDSIIADLESQRPGSKITDYCHVIFKYKKVRVVLHASCLARAKTTHLVVHGSKASFSQQALDKQEELLSKGIIPESKEWDEMNINHSVITVTNENNREEEVDTSSSGSYISFYRAVADSIQNGSSEPVDPKDVVSVTRMLEKITAEGALA